MACNGTGTDNKLLRHLSIGQTAGHPAQDLHFACRQTREFGCCVLRKDRCQFCRGLGGYGCFPLSGQSLFRGHGAPLRPISGKYPLPSGTACSSHSLFIGSMLNRWERCSHRLSQGLCRTPQLCRPQDLCERCSPSRGDACYSLQTGGDLELVTRLLSLGQTLFIKHTCSRPVLLYRSDITQLGERTSNAPPITYLPEARQALL